MALYKNNKQDGSTILIAGTGGIGSIEADSAFDSTSINPVQNKVVSAQFDIIDKILYKKYISIVKLEEDYILSIDKVLKLYDKIVFPATTDQKEIIITYKDNTQETIIINKENNPTIFIGDNFSFITIPQGFKATIYRCVDEEETRKLQLGFNQLEKQINNNEKELKYTGILVPNLIYDLDFSFGNIDENGTEINSKSAIIAKYSFDKNVDSIIKSINKPITIKIGYEDGNGEYQIKSYTLNEENSYIQKFTFNEGYEYRIIFSSFPEVELNQIGTLLDKIGIYIPTKIIADVGNVPVSNGDGTWSWRNLENEIQKINLSWNGLTIEFYKQGKMVWMKVSGTLSTDLTINNAFTDTIVVPNGLKPIANDTMDVISGLYRFQVNAVEGTGFRIGQGKILSTETGTDITAGTELHFNRMYIC